MRINKTVPKYVLVLLILLTVFSCKKNSDTNVEPIIPPFDDEYEVNEAAEIMTLAAICYVAEGDSAYVIKDAIIQLLENTSLATAGNWQLVWGPGISGVMDNLVFVAVDSSTSPVSYAIAIRGTNKYSIDDIVQDLQAFHMVPFTYGAPGDSIAHGSMRGLDSLLNARDPVSGAKIDEFLHSIPDDGNKKMFITGHSQGGALAPLMTYWFIKSSGLVNRFTIETYAFAGPSVSNAIFKQNFFNSMPASASFHMVANSLDAVPYFWARYNSIGPNSIPTTLPPFYEGLIIGGGIYLLEHGVKYTQLDDQIYIGSFPPKDTVGIVHPDDKIPWYDYWLMVEHNHNNYLRLLGAEPLPNEN